MNWYAIIAICFLFWVGSAIFLLPFGVKTHEELGMDVIPGQPLSAPGNFRPGRLALRATLLSAVLFGLFYANYHYGWIGSDDLDITNWLRPDLS